MAMFLVQRNSGDETFATIMSEYEVIDYVNFSDCHGEAFEVYDISNMGEVKKLKYKGWQPECLIQFVDENGQTVISGYGEDH